MKYRFHVKSKQLLADTVTPVNIYLKLRDIYAGSCLLESSDYHGKEDSRSLICCDPLASFSIEGSVVRQRYPDGSETQTTLGRAESGMQLLDEFRTRFSAQTEGPGGLYGYMAYDAVQFMDSLTLRARSAEVPAIHYRVFRYIIVVDHFSNTLTLHEYFLEGQEQGLARMEQLIFNNKFSTYAFRASGDEESTLSDSEFLQLVEKAKSHCYRGDVFQLVLSRRFSQRFAGDDFNVYRALRSINPSPYLFYFDFGNFKIFGSSPESQLRISDNTVSIFPIAGTFKRTGNDQQDAVLAEQLAADEKENAEHVMLVDLARNDLSRHAGNVTVEVFKEIQFYSHVIHLVSEVKGILPQSFSPLQVVADTFPAGTLSGAPKFKAMTLIDEYENSRRGFYGGAIGFLGWNNSFNHAILIRSFLSKANTLTYQAGAGIVAKSTAESELQEVNNKISALRKAITMANSI